MGGRHIRPWGFHLRGGNQQHASVWHDGLAPRHELPEFLRKLVAVEAIEVVIVPPEHDDRDIRGQEFEGGGENRLVNIEKILCRRR
jgi:hypothetical protein